MSESERGEVQLDARWPDAASTMPPQFANSFAVSLGARANGAGLQDPDGVYLTAGVVAPPIVLGSPDEVAERLSALRTDGVEVQILAKLVLSPGRALELRDLLDTVLRQIDTSSSSGREEGPTDD